MTNQPDDLEQKIDLVLENIELKREIRKRLLMEKASWCLYGVALFSVIGVLSHLLLRNTEEPETNMPAQSDKRAEANTPAQIKWSDESREKYDQEMGELEEEILLYPDNPYAYWKRGNLYLNYGFYGPAIDDFTKAISLDDDRNEEYWRNRGSAKCLYYKGGQDPTTFRKAYEDFEVSLRLSSTPSTKAFTYFKFGECAFLLGRYDDAITFLSEGITLGSNENFKMELYHLRGQAWERKGFVHNSARDYAKAISERTKREQGK